MSLKVGCLLYAVGKQPSIPLINLGKNGHYDDDNDDIYGSLPAVYYYNYIHGQTTD